MLEVIKGLIVDYGQAVANRAFYLCNERIASHLDIKIEEILRKPKQAQILMMGQSQGEEFTHGEVATGILGDKVRVVICPKTPIDKGMTIICWGAQMTGVYVGQRAQGPMYPVNTPIVKTNTPCNIGCQITLELTF